MRDTGQCVQCGFCCRQANCGYGKWDSQHSKCIFLTEEDLCVLYSQIKEHEKHSRYPMFGGGCPSRLFNDRREKKLKELVDAVR